MLHESPYVLSMVIVILVYGHCDSSCVCLCVSRVRSAAIRGVARPDTEESSRSSRHDDMGESSLASLAAPGYHLSAWEEPNERLCF